MPQLETIRFHQPTLFAGQTGMVNTKDCVVHGVSLITSELTAEGHDLFVDSICLDELHALGSGMEQIPVNLDHGSGIMSMNGYIDTFRLDKGKWRGDWHLLKSHEETPVMLERCERQPGTFGLSLAFKGPKEGVKRGGKKCAHAEQLLSADCVVRPAANNGLFSVKEEESVDNTKKVMPDPITTAAEPTLAEVLKAVGDISTQLQAFKEIQDQLVERANQSVENEDPRDILDQLHNATDEQLADYNKTSGTNITRQEIDAAVAEYNSGLEADPEADVSKPAEVSPTAQVDAGTLATAAASGSTALGALAREVIELRAERTREKEEAKGKAEAIEFAAVQTKIDLIVDQRDKALELAEKLVVQNEALRVAGRTGRTPLKASIELAEVDKGGTVLEFEKVANAKYSELMKQSGMKDITARSQAITFAVQKHPEAYQLYRKRGTPSIEFGVK